MALHSAIALLPLEKASEIPEQPAIEPPAAMTVTRLPERSPVADIAKAEPITPQPVIPQPPIFQPAVPQLIVPVAPTAIPQPVIVETYRDVLAEDMPVEDVPTENVLVENVLVEGMPVDNMPVDSEGNVERSPLSDQAEVAAMAAVWDGFLTGLPSGLSGSNLQQILSLFGQPGQEDLFFDANQQPRISVVSHHLLEDKTPEQVFEDVVSPGLGDREGFEIQAYGEFAGGPVYEVVHGEIVHYLNIVPLNERSGSVLIVCDRPPGV